MLTINKLKLANQINPANTHQADSVHFSSPLQHLLHQQCLLLRLLNQQNRWQLFISTKPMLQRSWIKQAGLDEHKIVHLHDIEKDNIITVIEKALLAATSSFIAACLVNPLTKTDLYRLQCAVKNSGTHLFLTDDNFLHYNQYMTMSLAMNTIH